MNYLKKNDREYILIGIWDKSGFDSKGNKFKKPKSEQPWDGQKFFESKLLILNLLLKETKNFTLNESLSDCLICDEKNITSGRYIYKNFIWEDGIEHYVKKHNFCPPEIFMDLVFFYKPEKKIKIKAKPSLTNLDYIKINKNQMLIFDALLKHGGYTKKYIDLTNSDILRYSEHTGLLDFKMNLLERVVVAGNTTRVDKGDEEIFLPRDLSDLREYEYIFHTHPPTPKPGGRVTQGILYEVPSIGDILHFIDSFNEGNICGSLVVTAEGLYNIRKKDLNHEKIFINEDKLFRDYNYIFEKIQDDVIRKYGTKFTTEKFHNKIAKEQEYFTKFNEILNKYLIQIDFYPRIKHKSQWILDKVYLPIY
jgi:hypothetical protein